MILPECCVEQGMWKGVIGNKRHKGRVELVVFLNVSS